MQRYNLLCGKSRHHGSSGRGSTSRRGGSVLVEAAMVLIFVLVPLIMGVIQYFMVFGAANGVTQITRQGGRYAAVFGRKNAGDTPIPASGSTGCPTGSSQPCADIYITNRIKEEARVVNLSPDDISVAITPPFASRTQYRSITVTITYQMHKKKFTPFPVPNTYVRASTMMLE